MFDVKLREIKDGLVEKPAEIIGSCIHPTGVTVAGFFIGLATPVLSYFEIYPGAVACWLVNRIMDGLDGAIARRSDKSSDLGGYIDIIADFFLYAVIPLAIAFSGGSGSMRLIAAMILLAVFYLNAAVWMVASILFEKRARMNPGSTSFTMPGGLVEGFETIVFYTAMLLLPQYFSTIAMFMAGLTFLSLCVRFIQTILVLRREDNASPKELEVQ